MPSVSTFPDTTAGGAATPARLAGILATGSCVPDGVISNADLEQLVETSDAWILERTGISQRHKVGAGVTTSVLAAAAGRMAMERAGVETVDAIIVATCTPDTFVPSTACLVQRRLNLPGIPAFDVNAACSGFVYGLALANSLIGQGAINSLLLIGAESLTQLVDYTDRSTCVLFGDGAGAAVLGPVASGGMRAVRWAADGSGSDLIYHGPKAGEDGAMSGPDGLRMLGKGTFRLAVERMIETVGALCADAGWSPDDIDVVIPHQANLRIIEAVSKRIGVPLSRFMVNIDRMGNTSAASIPIAMDEAASTGRLRDSDRVIFVGFGAGITWGGAAMEWTRPASR